SAPSVERASVSSTTSNASCDPSTAVRQTPSTATESPSAAWVCASTTSRRPSKLTTRPTSRTIPVNICSLAVGERFHRLADHPLEVAALAGEGVAERHEQLLDGGSLPGRELVGADLLDPLAQLVVADRAHQPLREQADDLVVGALEVTVRGHRPGAGRRLPPARSGAGGDAGEIVAAVRRRAPHLPPPRVRRRGAACRRGRPRGRTGPA